MKCITAGVLQLLYMLEHLQGVYAQRNANSWTADSAPEIRHDLDLGAIALDIVEQQLGAAGPLDVHAACVGSQQPQSVCALGA